MDIRRKNASRETTGTLKAWLYEHIKNPYPTKAEKVMLAIISKMSLTQVSTWFANARRRIKKDNRPQLSSVRDCSNTQCVVDDDDDSVVMETMRNDTCNHVSNNFDDVIVDVGRERIDRMTVTSFANSVLPPPCCWYTLCSVNVIKQLAFSRCWSSITKKLDLSEFSPKPRYSLLCSQVAGR